MGYTTCLAHEAAFDLVQGNKLAFDDLGLIKYGIHNIIKPYAMILPVLL
jgi:hypothetical protein